MKPIDTYSQLLESRGVPLRELGLREVALGRADVLAAIELLRMGAIPILGGDVYWQHQNGIELAYANWHSDPQEGEVREQFAIRSCREAHQYVSGFPASDAVPLFSLVIDV